MIAKINKFKYDNSKFDFARLVEKDLKEFSNEEFGKGFDDLESLHLNEAAKTNIEAYRQKCFSIFRSENFQKIYKEFGSFIIDKFFTDSALIQKTPTVRIQLPNEPGASYHSDGWFGHGSSVTSFWVPLTKVGPGNTLYMAENEASSQDAMEKIIVGQLNLAEINNLGSSICKPVSGQPGDIIAFSSNTIHGTNIATANYTRVSFDFRVAADPLDLGIKPRSNYFSRSELSSDKSNNGSLSPSLTGLFYTNKCKGKSAKAQLAVTNDFAVSNNIKILGGDSEILPLAYLPVLQNYITSKDLNIDCILVFGLDIFDSDVSLAKYILIKTIENDRELVFCAEGISFKKGQNMDEILSRI